MTMGSGSGCGAWSCWFVWWFRSSRSCFLSDGSGGIRRDNVGLDVGLDVVQPRQSRDPIGCGCCGVATWGFLVRFHWSRVSRTIHRGGDPVLRLGKWCTAGFVRRNIEPF